MSDKASPPSPMEDGSSISWKLIRENLARREFAPTDLVKVETVTSEADGKVEISGKDAAGAPVQRQVESNAAFERIAAASVQTSLQIKELHDQARKEAILWFWASMAAAILGFLLIVVGITAVLFFQQGTVAALTAVGGVLLEGISVLFFNQRAAANKRVDGYREDLLGAQAINQAIDLCRTMPDPETKKRLIEEIVKTLLDTAIGQKAK